MSVARHPARESVAVAMLPGLVALVALAVSTVTFALGFAGLAVAAAAAARGSRRGVTAGCGGLFLGVVVAGVDGHPPGIVLLAAAGTVVAWTTAQHVVGLGRQLGPEAPVRRSVLVHLAGTTIMTVGAGGVALAVFATTSGSLPISAVVALLMGLVVLLVTLDPS